MVNTVHCYRSKLLLIFTDELEVPAAGPVSDQRETASLIYSEGDSDGIILFAVTDLNYSLHFTDEFEVPAASTTASEPISGTESTDSDEELDSGK